MCTNVQSKRQMLKYFVQNKYKIEVKKKETLRKCLAVKMRLTYRILIEFVKYYISNLRRFFY